MAMQSRSRPAPTCRSTPPESCGEWGATVAVASRRAAAGWKKVMARDLPSRCEAAQDIEVPRYRSR